MPLRPSHSPAFVRSATLGSLGLLALAACTPRAVETSFAPACPRVSILADAADLTRFRRPGSRDLTDMVLDGRITGVSGTCERGDDGQLLATIRTSIELSRGPATPGREVTAPLFVAVVRNGRVQDKQLYRAAATFPANTDRVRIASDDVNLVLPVGGKISGPSYDVFVGFELTPAEQATNQARGPR